jgi:hypothetical protein
MLNARAFLAHAGAAAASFAIVFAPQAAAYLILNGHIGPHASVSHKMNWASPHALQVLFSAQHGFFVWTPLAAIAIAGIALGRSRIALCLLLMVALQIYIGGSVESWTVAGGFGQRRFIALTTALVIGLSFLFAESARGGAARRTALSAIAVMCVYWNLALIAEFATGLMDRQRLEPRRNAYDALVTLPRMAPRLAYRYLFDRASFYKPRQ